MKKISNKLKNSTISSIDELIILQTKKLELLKLHKKGLSQMLNEEIN